jgi:hypothetical protein
VQGIAVHIAARIASLAAASAVVLRADAGCDAPAEQHMTFQLYD